MPHISSPCRQIWKEKVRNSCLNRVGDMLPNLHIYPESVRVLCDYICIRKLSPPEKHGGLHPPGRVLARPCLEDECPHALPGWHDLGRLTNGLPVRYQLGRCLPLCWTIHELVWLGSLHSVVHTRVSEILAGKWEGGRC